jgi:hypothetical protein
MEPTKLVVYPWGDGVGDVRYFTPQIFMPSELEGLKQASGYMPQALTLEGAVKSIQLTMEDAKPGIYFAGNPLEGTYGKWLVALKAAGWKQVPGCALNRVWGGWESYKGPGSKHGTSGNPKAPAWESKDGFHKWIHAFYTIVPGRKKAVEFDFSAKFRDLKATTGDVDLTKGSLGSLWHINYMGGRSIKNVGGTPRWCPNWGRLSKSCGIAMGFGLPECGKELDEEFFCIAAQEQDKKWPKGWNAFLEYGGLSWATNLGKLDTSQEKCPHPLEV